MKLKGVFQVYKNNDDTLIQNLDGRLLDDLSINAELFVCKDPIGDILISTDENELLKTDIIEIVSYCKAWNRLSKGMSARIKCKCSKKIRENEVIFKVYV